MSGRIVEIKVPENLQEMIDKADLVASEINECVNAGGDWRGVTLALMGFALEVRNETIAEIERRVKK